MPVETECSHLSVLMFKCLLKLSMGLGRSECLVPEELGMVSETECVTMLSKMVSV